jgi:hypothetical protein
MKNLLLSTTLFIAGAGLVPAPAIAATISVQNIGSIFNQSEDINAASTPGSGITFAQFFEFTLPTRETITVSMSDSGVGSLAIVDGVLSLNTHTSTGPSPLFIPSGTLLESAPLLNVVGGQEATVTPDVLSAGSYFAEVNGISGSSRIKLAIDGTVTGISAIPEPSTWAMFVLGFIGLAWVGYRNSRPRNITAF